MPQMRSESEFGIVAEHVGDAVGALPQTLGRLPRGEKIVNRPGAAIPVVVVIDQDQSPVDDLVEEMLEGVDMSHLLEDRDEDPSTLCGDRQQQVETAQHVAQPDSS